MNLFERIFKQSRVDEETSKVIFRNIIQCVNTYKTQTGKWHDRLKIESFLIDADNNVELIADSNCKRQRSAPEALTTVLVNNSYEFVEAKNELDEFIYDEKSVAFELGIILFSIRLRALPFQFAYSDDWWFNKLSSSDLKKKELFWIAHNPNNKHNLSDEFVSLIELLLAKDPSSRPSFYNIMEHPWFE